MVVDRAVWYPGRVVPLGYITLYLTAICTMGMPQLKIKKNSHFWKPKISLLYLLLPTTCPYPEPYQSNPSSSTHFQKIHLNIIPFTPGYLFLSFPHQNLLYAPPPQALHAPPISISLLSPEQYWVSSTGN